MADRGGIGRDDVCMGGGDVGAVAYSASLARFFAGMFTQDDRERIEAGDGLLCLVVVV